MSWLNRIFRSRKEIVSQEDLARALGGESWTGKEVDRISSMGIAATWAAVRLLSDSVASLPLVYYRRSSNGKVKAVDDPLFPLLGRRPNDESTSYSWRETSQHHLLLKGNAYSRLVRNGAGRIIQIWLMDAEKVTIERSNNSGELFYIYTRNGVRTLLNRDEVLHIPGLGWDGMTGYSPMAIVMQEFGYSIAVKEYGSEFFKNDGTPGGYLKFPQGAKLKDEAAIERLKRTWGGAHTGWGNKHSLGVLEDGAEFMQMTLPPEHMQFIESQKFSVTDIARIFRVPPHMIGDLSNATFSNIESQSIDFVVNSLRPWLVRWEQNLNNQLIPENQQGEFFFEFNVNALLRGDFETRAKGYRTFVEMGALTQNEVRNLENFNTDEKLNEFYVPLNWQKIEDTSLEESTEPGVSAIVDDAVKATSLNGAQIKSLLEIIQGVAVGDISMPTAKALIEAGFPGISNELVLKMLDNVKALEKPDDKIVGTNNVRLIDGPETRQTRSALARFKLSNRFRSLFEDVINKIVRKEARDIKVGVNKHLDTRGDADFNLFLDQFYDGLPEFIRKQIAPTYRTFASSVKDEVAREIDIDGELTEQDESFIESFVTVFIGRYIAKSQSDLRKAMEAAVDSGSDLGEAVDGKIRHWEETRADWTAHNETVRSGNAFTKVFMIAAGVTLLRWVTVGKNCPFCDSLDGNVVGVEQDFALPNDVIEAEGKGLGVRSNIGHPPIHRGCDCQIVAGG